ncbi:MAG TPA: STAS domain-containing protein [Phototrophicaceae bacterium]|nr:STAS domain-containing protein [Phototrophicaceae bacterium]
MKSSPPAPEIEHRIFSHPALYQLTRPHSKIQKSEIRFKSQLLATILGALILLMSALTIAFVLKILGEGITATPFFVLSVLLVEYFLNRAGFYHLSATILMLLLIIVLVVLPMAGVTSSGVILIAPIILLLAAIFFSGQFLVWTFVALIICFLTLNAIFPDALKVLPADTLRNDALMFFLFQGTFVFVLIYSRDLIESQRRTEIIGINARLEETNQALQTATETVKQSEAKWRAILANAPVMIVYTALDGQIEFINKWIGGRLEETQGKSIYDIVPPTEGQRVRQLVQQVIEQKIPATYQLTEQRANGPLTHLSTIVGLVTVEGQETGLAFISNDVTQQIQASEEYKRLQQQVIDSQKQLLKELSTPVIPILDRVIIMPIIGSIDSSRAQDMTRALLAGISANRAHYVVLDVTGVPVVDTGVAQHLSRTIQAARLKGAQTIVTGISDSIAETIVDLGLDWSSIETQRDLQTGLLSVINRLDEKSKENRSPN